MPDFTVDEQTVKSFEEAFDTEEGIIKFIDKEDRGEVKLRNKKLVGYKKNKITHVPKKLYDKGRLERGQSTQKVSMLARFSDKLERENWGKG